MKISFEKPPIYEEAAKLFKLEPGTGTFFTYGDTIYSPDQKMPSDDLIRHEETHAEQQAHDDTAAKLWWQRYFVDPDFRIDQEAEAYGAQYKFLKGGTKDRERLHKILFELAKHLSSPMYGSAITHAEAMKLIRGYAEGTIIKDIEKHMPDMNDPNV